MASDLKWRTGFGWGFVFVLLATLILAIFASGWLRWAALVLALLAALFMVAKYRMWNAKGWTSVHYRGMLLFSGLAGLESGRAEAEGRPLDRVAPCRELALNLYGPGFEVMFEKLQREEGSYLASLLEQHKSDLFPGAEEAEEADEAFGRIVSEVREKAQLGPELVICNVVENEFGSLEAARYALAMIEGEAK